MSARFNFRLTQIHLRSASGSSRAAGTAQLYSVTGALELAKQIAVARVSSNLDYCKSRFHNMSVNDFARLQRVESCLVRVTIKSPHFTRSVPILKRLHWLPVISRIIFKICTMTFRTLQYNTTAEMLKISTLHKCKYMCCSPYKNQDWVKRFLYS